MVQIVIEGSGRLSIPQVNTTMPTMRSFLCTATKTVARPGSLARSSGTCLITRWGVFVRLHPGVWHLKWRSFRRLRLSRWIYCVGRTGTREQPRPLGLGYGLSLRGITTAFRDAISLISEARTSGEERGDARL